MSDLQTLIETKLENKDYEVKKDFSDFNNAALDLYITALAGIRADVTDKWTQAGSDELEDLAKEIEIYETDDPDDLADALEECGEFIDDQLKTALYEKQRRNLQGGEDSELKGNCDKLGKGYPGNKDTA